MARQLRPATRSCTLWKGPAPRAVNNALGCGLVTNASQQPTSSWPRCVRLERAVDITQTHIGEAAAHRMRVHRAAAVRVIRNPMAGCS